MLETIYFLELAFYTFIFLLLFLIIFFPIGNLIVSQLKIEISPEFQFLLSLALGILFQALLIGISIKFGLNNHSIAWLIRIIVIASTAHYFTWQRKNFKPLAKKENLYITILFYLFLLLSNSVTALPNNNWRNISHEQTRMIFNLPVDNFLPYQGARFILDRLNPNNIQVAGGWKFSDRGPLAALATATVFLFANIDENNHWSDASRGLVFIYQTLVSSLNLLALLVVYFICLECFGLSCAIMASLFLCSNYFFIMNTAFTWPKFFMIFYFFLGLYFLKKSLSLWIPGVLVAAALLSHNSVVFSLPVLGLFLLFQLSKKYSLSPFKPKEIFLTVLRTWPFLLGFIATLAPWSHFKRSYAAASEKLLFMHLLCDQSDTMPTTGSFQQAFLDHLKNTPLEKMLHTAFVNLVYPVDVVFTWEALGLLKHNILLSINILCAYTFFQLYLAVGVIAFLAFIVSLFLAYKDQKIKNLVYIVLISFSSYPVASLLFACERTTHNHHCGYPAFTISMILAAYILSKNNFLSNTLAKLQIGFSLMFAAIFIYYHSELRIFMHASPYYFSFQALIVLLILLLPLIIFRKIDNNYE